MTSSVTKQGLALAALMTVAVGGAQQIQVQVNGDPVTFADVQPQTIGSVVMVPIRSVCDKLGAPVDWDPATQAVSCKVNGSDVVLHIGSSEAMVDGQMRYLDLPPTIENGRTLVPMRFLGESLGNAVTWNGDTNLVAITTNATATSPSATTTTTTTPQVVTLNENEVVPVTLDNTLSSESNHIGDTFTATVSDNGTDGYASIPTGSKIEGHIAAVEPMQGNQPAILDLAFDRITFPNGTTEPIDGSMVSLDNQYVMVSDDGVYEAQDSGKTFNRMVYAGYGSSGGMMVGIMDTQPLDTTALQSDQSAIEAQIPEDENQKVEISIPAGTQLGVRINRQDSLNL